MTGGRSCRILVVEDEALILMATLDMLRELGHEPLAARCAEMAISRFDRDAPIDLLLTDVNLPDTHGHLLAAELRRRKPGLPVIFATGYRLTVTESVAASGPIAILNKPFLASELAEAIRKVLTAPVEPAN
jgi:CheY-like chemotaxis protein